MAEVPAERPEGSTTIYTDPKRMASLLGGGTMAAWGLRRGGLFGLGIAALGGVLAWSGATGQSVAGTVSRMARPVTITRSITIGRPRKELWEFWRRQENLARFMTHVLRIEPISETRYHWVVRGPMGVELHWDCELDPTPTNERIAWTALPGADIHNEGEVVFRDAPGGRGTEIHVTLTYRPPAGRTGRFLAQILGEEPEKQTAEDLRHLKQILETGETASNAPTTSELS